MFFGLSTNGTIQKESLPGCFRVFLFTLRATCNWLPRMAGLEPVPTNPVSKTLAVGSCQPRISIGQGCSEPQHDRASGFVSFTNRNGCFPVGVPLNLTQRGVSKIRGDPKTGVFLVVPFKSDPKRGFQEKPAQNHKYNFQQYGGGGGFPKMGVFLLVSL